MPTFSTRRLEGPSQLGSKVHRKPFIYFGLPFLVVMVAASFGLEGFTRTKYDLHEAKVTTMSKEEELNMSKNRRKIDLKEEYLRLQNAGSFPSSSSQDWENVRVPRPKGAPEWGVAAGGDVAPDAPIVGKRGMAERMV